MLNPSIKTNPKYRVQGQIQYLDSWITENFSSICSFTIDTLRKNKVPIKAKDWLNLKPISDCQKYGLKLHHPPKVISKPITQVNEAPSFSPNNASFKEKKMSPTLGIQVHPAPVIEMASVAKVNSAHVVSTSCSQDLTDTRALIRDPNIHPSKEPIKGSNTAYSTQAKTIPFISMTQFPKISRIPVAVPTNNQDSTDIKVSNKNNDPMKVKNTSVEDSGLPRAFPRNYSTPAIDTARVKKDAALIKISQRPSYKGFLHKVLTANTPDPIISTENSKVDNLSTIQNGECLASQD